MLDELGIQMNEELDALPTAQGNLGPAETKKQPQAALSDADADLQQRLENLRRE